MNLEPLLAAVPGAAVEESYGTVTVDVAPGSWAQALLAARDALGCTFFDFLSAVDEGDGVRVVCHLARRSPFGHLVVRTLLPAEAPAIASVAAVYAGARWHERETAEMFGVRFLDEAARPVETPHLLLSEGFVGHPLRKEFLLRSRLERPWPGAVEPKAVEPGEDASSPSRRRLRPPGVPEERP